MDIRLLLVKMICLVYHEGKLKGNLFSNALIEMALTHIQLPENISDLILEKNVLVNLKATLTYLLNSHDKDFDKPTLLSRLRINVGKDDTVYGALIHIINVSDEERVKTVNVLRNEIQEFISHEQLKAKIKELYLKSSFKQGEIKDWAIFRAEALDAINGVNLISSESKDNSYVMSIDFSDIDSVNEVVDSMTKVNSEEGSLGVPWKAFGRFFGASEKVKRGMYGNINALPHSNKSGVLLDLFLYTILYTKPFLFDNSKKPAIVFYSTEDTAETILRKIFIILKQIEHGLPVIVSTFSAEDIAKYVHEKLGKTEWNVFIHQVKPSDFTYLKYIASLEKYKSDGYEVIQVNCDYLSMMNKVGCNNSSTGDDIQDLHRRVREYTSAQKITHWTAHQLSTEAKTLSRMKPEDFIFDLPGKGFYEGCKKLDTEVDFEAYINKRVVHNGAYLEFIWGKLRGTELVAEKNKYFALKFRDYPMIGIEYDTEDTDKSYTKVGGKSKEEGGGNQWFDLSE